jgi:transposase, IS30 family
MQYKHFSIEERELIQKGLWEKLSVRAIARQLGRPHSSVLREIQRNQPPQVQRYTPRLAHERAVKKRSSRGRHERLKNTCIREYVVTALKRRRSPEQIAGCIEHDIGETISPEAIQPPSLGIT